MSRRPKGLLIAVMMLATAGCASRTPEPPKTVSDYCLIAKRMSYAELRRDQVDDPGNKADTPETVKQVKDHNSEYACVCGGDCPKPL